jgi:hypothetical protein
VAEPGTDAAAGDGSRSAARVNRAPGWRVPSVTITRPGVPDAWIDGGSGPAVIASSSPGAVDEPSHRPELAEFGRAEAMIRRWRGWSFRARRREPTAGGRAFAFAATDTADLDLVALEAEDDAWTDVALASLEETDPHDTWSTGPRTDDPGAPAGPWSLLAEELPPDDLKLDAPGEIDAPLDAPAPDSSDLEAEFWAEGTR